MHTEDGNPIDSNPIKRHLTPFKRGRSRVYYDSDSDHQFRLGAANYNLAYRSTESINPTCTANHENFNVINTIPDYRNKSLSPPSQFCPDSPFYTPLRCSPSQRSQDSGYSDSGESNSEKRSNDITPSPPTVKHITRIYFGQVNKSLPSKTNENSIVSDNYIPLSCPISRKYKVCRRRLNSHSRALKKHENKSISSSLRKINEKIESSDIHSSPTTENNSVSTEEVHEYLEHKTLFRSNKSGLQECKNIDRKLFHSSLSDSIQKTVIAARNTIESNKLNNTLPITSSSCIKNKSKPHRWSGSDFRCSTPLQSKNINCTSGNNSSYIPIEIPSNSFYSSKCDTSPSAYDIADSMRNESLCQWLAELRITSEIECMNTLQSKSINVSREYNSSKLAIKSIQKQSHLISTQFAFLCQKLESRQLEEIPSILKSLVDYIENFVDQHCPYTSSTNDGKCLMSRQVRVLDQICTKLMDICTEPVLSGEVSCSSIKTIYELCEDESTYSVDQEFLREVVQVVTALGHAFTKLVDILLCHEVKIIVKNIEESERNDKLHDAISQITSLGVDGGHICRIVSRMGGIRALLEVCILPKCKHLLPPSLRAIATICCVPEGISHFEQEGGVEIIADILCNFSYSEDDRSEAAGVLAQIISPWAEGSLNFSSLRNYLTSIVNALNVLTKETSSNDIFLLSAAALANLTFLDAKCVECLIASKSYEVLISKTKTADKISVYIKDQVATVMANLSSSSMGARAITEAGGIPVLVTLINTRPVFSRNFQELSAIEHVQQKSAIAISRLCSDAVVGRLVLKFGGAKRLVELCKNCDERNGSDAVLVACLAALRKLASSCGEAEVRKVDGAELIEPRLLDSFMIYSSQNENYV